VQTVYLRHFASVFAFMSLPSNRVDGSTGTRQLMIFFHARGYQSCCQALCSCSGVSFKFQPPCVRQKAGWKVESRSTLNGVHCIREIYTIPLICDHKLNVFVAQRSSASLYSSGFSNCGQCPVSNSTTVRPPLAYFSISATANSRKQT